MKVTTQLPAAISPASKPEPTVSDRLDRTSPSTGDRVKLSADATWVKAVKDEIRREPDIRQDLVDRTREAVAAGTYESAVDLDTLVTNFLADL